MDSSTPTILRPRVQIPSIPSTLFVVTCCTIFVIVLKKDEKQEKEAWEWPIFKKQQQLAYRKLRTFFEIATVNLHEIRWYTELVVSVDFSNLSFKIFPEAFRYIDLNYE